MIFAGIFLWAMMLFLGAVLEAMFRILIWMIIFPARLVWRAIR